MTGNSYFFNDMWSTHTADATDWSINVLGIPVFVHYKEKKPGLINRVQAEFEAPDLLVSDS